ncbi:HAD hydrolase-like protein [Arcanobacterium ihumii]|uniref:HAD hydrolase-like protein n=1 Tax=Arcanobacterium ihumii TaxID=2138162 RepID=UPI000F53151D|nr:HAD hydrolase-like protein [Arcanobacterium ihumii]
MNKLKAILFDLDGTLTDSAPLICEAMHATMEEKAGRDLPLDSFLRYVGPPLRDSFKELGVEEDQIEDYIQDYRRRYVKVMDQTPLFEGIDNTLREIKDRLGVPLLIATSKQTPLAKEVCDNLGITPLLYKVCGAPSDTAHSTKALVVADALRSLYDDGVVDIPPQEIVTPGVPRNDALLRSDVVMVGDRIFDIEGAGAHCIRTILVQWGDAPQSEHDLAWRSVYTQAQLIETLEELNY